MDLHFLGGASTVTGSQFLLETGRARVLVDCGMFQGSPNEAMRNRVPFGFEAATLDVLLLTHAHLDHCGLIPHLVNAGYRGRIVATRGTAELAELVLLDSGKLQQEFAKREARWERKHPDKAGADDRKEHDAYQAALDLAEGRISELPPEARAAVQSEPSEAGRPPAADTATVSSAGVSEEVSAAMATPAPIDMEADLRGQPAEITIDLDEPLYTADEAKAAIEHFDTIEYEEEREVAPGVHATYLDAGHILGSAIIRLRIEAGDGSSTGPNAGPERETTIIFSGDLGRPGTPIIRDPAILRDTDYLLVESTYGGREHEPEAEAIRILAETVQMVSDAGGVLLVPSFAIGRTQEIVYQLDRLLEQGRIPELPLYLDSPMASKASDIYRRHAEYFDEPARALLEQGDTPLDYPNQTVTNDVHDSQAIERAPRPYMIVASNGMLTGGRVLGHLRNLIGDPSATILFVGYQGEGTLGSHLQAGATTVKLDGQPRDVRCQVRSISGFSAHADESELLEWLGHFAEGKAPGAAGFPKTVFLVHGDPEAQIAIEPKVQALGFTTKIPRWRETVTLD
ncbi:MAG TPA: MBL fold metallo-hydrolase [Patescibacteria group bacterium]|nr:MBL fold metallo-hydrolase [Patescibacteria group bacterium]